MDIFLLWLFAQANDINNVLLVGTIVTGILGAFILITVLMGFVEGQPVSDAFTSKVKPLFFGFAFFLFMFVVVPDRTGLAIIVGGKLAIDGTQTEQFTGTASKIYELVHQELDTRLEKED